MDEKDIVIPQDKSRLLYNARQRVASLFDVEVGGFTNKANRNSGSQWINLKGRADNIVKAKKYINSLCSSEIETFVEFPSELLKEVQEKGKELEKSNCVYICFPSNSKALIQGCEHLDVVISQSSLEEFINKNSKNSAGSSVQRDLTSDSSIDATQNPLYTFNTPERNLDPLDLDSLKDFASKLGYTDEDVQSVIRKLGQNVNKNQLLNELIQVNRSARFLRDERPRTSPQLFAHTQTHSNGLSTNGTPRSDIIARGAPSAPPDRTVVSRGASTPRLENEFIPRALVENEVRTITPSPGLRPIVIDGSNVAMSHGNQKVFSCHGIQICVNWFLQRGHTEIFVFVPMWRKEASKPEAPIINQEVLNILEERGFLKYTPARRVKGRRVVCYDDRYIIKLAAEMDGIVVSNDNFRDLQNESLKFQEVVEKRLLMFSFVNDFFLPPDDPLGRYGPSLDEFLLKGTESSPRICPFLQKRKCTYGARCRYYHPERDGSVKTQPDLPSKPVTESNSSSEIVSRDFGAVAPRGTVIPHPDLRAGVVSPNVYAQQRMSGVNVHGPAGHGDVREQYGDSYSRPGPHPQYPYDYRQVYQPPQQYMVPSHGQWVDGGYVVPRGHPHQGYPAAHYPPNTAYQHQLQPRPHMDFIPAMPAYPAHNPGVSLSSRMNSEHRDGGMNNKSMIIGDRQVQFHNLMDVFMHEEAKVLTVMQNHPNERDVNKLADYVSAIV